MRTGALLLGCCVLVGGLAAEGQAAAVVKTSTTAVILDRGEAEKIMPATVFFRGQTATTQGRNSAGIRLAGGQLVLAALVDASGYSSGIAEKYQAYLITEVGLRVGNKRLVAGAYGLGFVANDRVVVMDLGGRDVLNEPTMRDGEMKRPTPLQIASDGKLYRLYLGRSYVTLAPEAEK